MLVQPGQIPIKHLWRQLFSLDKGTSHLGSQKQHLYKLNRKIASRSEAKTSFGTQGPRAQHMKAGNLSCQVQFSNADLSAKLASQFLQPASSNTSHKFPSTEHVDSRPSMQCKTHTAHMTNLANRKTVWSRPIKMLHRRAHRDD